MLLHIYSKIMKVSLSVPSFRTDTIFVLNIPKENNSESNKRAMMALGRSPEYHWNQIISKSVHRFSRSRFKLFSIYSPGGHFVQQSGTV